MRSQHLLHSARTGTVAGASESSETSTGAASRWNTKASSRMSILSPSLSLQGIVMRFPLRRVPFVLPRSAIQYSVPWSASWAWMWACLREAATDWRRTVFELERPR